MGTVSNSSLSNADYAIDKSAIKRLLRDWNDDLVKVKKTLTGAEYKDVVKAIDKAWVGEDATAFKKYLEDEIKSIEEPIKNAQTEIETELDTLVKEFEELQQKRASNIKTM